MAKEAMKALINLEHPFLHTPKIPLLRHETAKNLNFNRRRPPSPWRLQAEAKGFGRGPQPPPATKIKPPKFDDDNNRGGNSDDNDEKIPEEVWNRITRRILFYVGAPLVTGLVLLQIIDLVKEQRILEVPNWVPALTIFVFLGASTLGVAFGALSASWDSDKEGSVLGFEEAQKNWVDMWNED